MTVDFRQLNARIWEVVRVTTAGEQQLGCLECPYFGGDQGKLTVFKYLFQPATLQYALFEHELQEIAAFGNERERQARAAYLSELSEGAAQKPTVETKPVRIVDKAEPLATDLDSVAERILAAFKSEDETLTDADLLAASGLDREAYLDIRDFLLIETEEISETAEDTAPTEYVRNWPRKAELN